MTLIDTSIWIDHLRKKEPRVVSLLTTDQVLIHPFIQGELACGTMNNRAEVLYYLGNLPKSPMATHEEVLYFIEQHQLMGRGLGYVDLHLLAATALHGTARLWTRDRRLARAAVDLDLAFVAKAS